MAKNSPDEGKNIKIEHKRENRVVTPNLIKGCFIMDISSY